MANIKTFTDTNRLDLNFDRYDVFEVMPGHYDELYPNLATFLKKYYETLDQKGNPAQLVNELLTNRDVMSVQSEFLGFLSNELLLGKPYFEQFNDKRTALQFSNLLYRSKGTEYSIQQFFRIFFSIDVEVEYGRDYIFRVGEPLQEHMEFETEGSVSGSTFRYTFAGAPVLIYTRDSDSQEWTEMRQDIDYVQNFADKRIEFLKRSKVDIRDEKLVEQNDFYQNLAETGFLGFDSDEPQTRLKIVTNRKDQTTIGSSSNKNLTDDKFYQLFALLIQTPVGVSTWKEAYKTFIHPAGMYLLGRVRILSQAKIRVLASTVVPDIFPPLVGTAKVFGRSGTGTFSTSVSELGPGPYGYQIRSRVNDMRRPEQKWEGPTSMYDSDWINVGSQDDSDGSGWGHEYLTMHRADNINSRTLDATVISLSNTINTLDENVWTGRDSDGYGHPWLPGEIIIRPELTNFLTTEGSVFITTEEDDNLEL